MGKSYQLGHAYLSISCLSVLSHNYNYTFAPILIILKEMMIMMTKNVMMTMMMIGRDCQTQAHVYHLSVQRVTDLTSNRVGLD